MILILFCSYSDKTSSDNFHMSSIFRHLSTPFGVKCYFFTLLMIVISILKTWSQYLLMFGSSIPTVRVRE